MDKWGSADKQGVIYIYISGLYGRWERMVISSQEILCYQDYLMLMTMMTMISHSQNYSHEILQKTNSIISKVISADISLWVPAP